VLQSLNDVGPASQRHAGGHVGGGRGGRLGQHAQLKGAISGAAGLVKRGGGVLELSGANSFGGPGQSVLVAEGTLSVSSDAQLGSGNNTLGLAGGALRASSGFTSTRPLSVAAGRWGTIEVVAGQTLTLSGLVDGHGPPDQDRGGNLNLTSAANPYAGGVVARGGGTLTLAVVPQLAAGTLGGGNWHVYDATLAFPRPRETS